VAFIVQARSSTSDEPLFKTRKKSDEPRSSAPAMGRRYKSLPETITTKISTVSNGNVRPDLDGLKPSRFG
jgi:hypothetical protein